MKTHSYVFFLITFLILSLVHSPMSAQTRIEYRGNSTWNGDVNDFWVLESTYSHTTSIRVYLHAELKDAQGELIFQATSQDLNLPIGRHNFNPGEIITRESSSLIPLEIKEGSYLLFLSMVQVQNAQVIANTSSNVLIKSLENLDSAGKKKLIQFSGRMRLYGQLSNRISLFDDYDPNYLNLEIQPKLSIKGLPFSGQIFLSTQENSLRYDLNTGGINFDVNQFRQQLQQKFLQKLGQQKERLSKGLPLEGDFGQSLEKLRNDRIAKIRESFKGKIPANLTENINKARKAWEETDRIDEILSLRTFKELDKEWDNWVREQGFDPKMDYEELRAEICEKKPESCKKHMQLLAKKEEFEKLKARKKELEALKAKYQKLRKYGDQIKELKDLEAGDFRSLLQQPALLSKLPLYEKGQKLLTSVRKLGIGTVFPFYSPLTLDGISLQGWDMEFQPGKVYLATSGGKLGQSAFYGLSDTSQNREGRLIAGKMGYGQVEGNHLYTTWMMGQWEDLEEGVPTGSGIAGRQLLLGLEGQLSLLRDKWLLKGEWVQAMESLSDSETNEAWSLASKAQFFDGKTLVNGSYEKLMPGYFSIGAPLLLKESERFNLEVTQSFFKNKFQARAYIRKNASQLLPHSFESVSVKSAGLSLRFQADRLPYVQADYAPYYQDFGAADTSLQQGPSNGVMTVQSGYLYNVGSWQMQSTLSYSQQMGRSSEGSGTFSSSLIGWNQMVQFNSIWGLNSSASYIHSQYSAAWDKTWTVELSGFARLKSGIYSSLGINYLKEQGEEGLFRKGLFLDNTIPLGKKIQAQLRLEYSHNENYRPDTPFYKEYLLRGGLTYSW